MLRLYIMRHAKSSWAIPGARDFDRELNDRGISDLTKISQVLKSKQYVPDMVICSSSIRTTKTFEGIEVAMNPRPKVIFTPTLYSSGLDDYMRVINDVVGSKSLMIIGHNPMCGTLAHSLVGDGPTELVELISYKYPTSTITVFDFDTQDWSEVAPGKGMLRDCILPKTV